MATLIDASVLIAAEGGRLDWDRVVADHATEEIALAAITASELLHGVHLLIGATALATGGRVATRDLGASRAFPGLTWSIGDDVRLVGGFADALSELL